MKVHIRIGDFGRFWNMIYFILGLFSAIVGYEIHHNLFFSIINFLCWPISLFYWAICHDINLSVIKAAFAWFLK